MFKAENFRLVFQHSCIYVFSLWFHPFIKTFGLFWAFFCSCLLWRFYTRVGLFCCLLELSNFADEFHRFCSWHWSSIAHRSFSRVSFPNQSFLENVESWPLRKSKRKKTLKHLSYSFFKQSIDDMPKVCTECCLYVLHYMQLDFKKIILTFNSLLYYFTESLPFSMVKKRFEVEYRESLILDIYSIILMRIRFQFCFPAIWRVVESWTDFFTKSWICQNSEMDTGTRSWKAPKWWHRSSAKFNGHRLHTFDVELPVRRKTLKLLSERITRPFFLVFASLIASYWEKKVYIFFLIYYFLGHGFEQFAVKVFNSIRFFAKS